MHDAKKPPPGGLFYLGPTRPGKYCRCALRDNIRRQLIFEPRHLIAQQKLALLQPLQLQLVRLAGVSQGFDRRVEVAVLLTQPLDLGDQRRMFLRRRPLLVHLAPLYASRSEPSTPSARRCRWVTHKGPFSALASSSRPNLTSWVRHSVRNA